MATFSTCQYFMFHLEIMEIITFYGNFQFYFKSFIKEFYK